MMDLAGNPAWEGFRSGEWRHLVNVRNFIQKNYTPYTGDESFLAGTTVSENTEKVWEKCRCADRGRECKRASLTWKPTPSQASTILRRGILTGITR